MPRVLVRETSVCSTKGQRPTLTTRHGSTRLVRANTQKPGLFWFPGRYPDSPLFSSTTPTPLSVSVSRDQLPLHLSSSFFLPSLFAHFARSGFLSVSFSLLFLFLFPSFAYPFRAALSPRSTVYPYVRETHRRVERRHGPEMGIDGVSATSDVRMCTRVQQ